jgi:hypothetical protein
MNGVTSERQVKLLAEGRDKSVETLGALELATGIGREFSEVLRAEGTQLALFQCAQTYSTVLSREEYQRSDGGRNSSWIAPRRTRVSAGRDAPAGGAGEQAASAVQMSLP